MALVRGGITVKPHVQAFADACHAATGADNYGTYNGHSPPEGPTQALDIFNPDNATGHALQDRICAYAMLNAERFGVRYVIRREHIWNIERNDEGWRRMGHNGNRTADHWDHVHITFYATGAARPDEPTKPIPKPEPVPEEVLPMEFSYIVGDEDWVWWGAERIHTRCAEGTVLDGVPHKRLGRKPKAFHEWLFAVAENAGFKR